MDIGYWNQRELVFYQELYGNKLVVTFDAGDGSVEPTVTFEAEGEEVTLDLPLAHDLCEFITEYGERHRMRQLRDLA